MASGLTVFIDEGGDSGVRDGLRFHHSRHEWFSLGAYIVRNESVGNTVSVRDDLMRIGNVTQSPDLHYYKLKPDRRQQVCEHLGSKPARALCLLSHKTNMRNYYNERLGKFDAIRFYSWCIRLLLERVMEFAETDATENGVHSIGQANFVFSENKGHDYDEMISYFKRLNIQSENNSFFLRPKRWIADFISGENVVVQPHSAVAGLQLADVIASAFLQGANSIAPNHNPQPATSLKPIVARDRDGSRVNSGLTLWPLPSQSNIPTAARPLFEQYGFRF
jgi:hypothetical protein